MRCYGRSGGRGTEGGTQTPDRNEPSARRRLIENSPAVFPTDCCVAALIYCHTEKTFTQDEKHVTQEQKSTNSTAAETNEQEASDGCVARFEVRGSLDHAERSSDHFDHSIS